MSGYVGTILLFWALLSVVAAYFIGAFLAAAKRGPRSDTPVFDETPVYDRIHYLHHGHGCPICEGGES